MHLILLLLFEGRSNFVEFELCFCLFFVLIIYFSIHHLFIFGFLQIDIDGVNAWQEAATLVPMRRARIRLRLQRQLRHRINKHVLLRSPNFCRHLLWYYVQTLLHYTGIVGLFVV